MRNVFPMVDTLTYTKVHFTVDQWKEGWFHQLNSMIGPQKLEILDLVILILPQVKADFFKNKKIFVFHIFQAKKICFTSLCDFVYIFTKWKNGIQKTLFFFWLVDKKSSQCAKQFLILKWFEKKSNQSRMQSRLHFFSF